MARWVYRPAPVKLLAMPRLMLSLRIVCPWSPALVSMRCSFFRVGFNKRGIGAVGLMIQPRPWVLTELEFPCRALDLQIGRAEMSAWSRRNGVECGGDRAWREWRERCEWRRKGREGCQVCLRLYVIR